MRTLPVADPGTPDARSPARLLWWLARAHGPTVAAGMVLGVAWMALMALVPAAIGRVVDAGLVARDLDALVRGSLVLAALGVGQAAAAILRHRTAVFNWLAGAYRVAQLAAAHAARVGAALPRRVPPGELVSVTTSDAPHVGHLLDVSARGTGAAAAVVIVAALLLRTSVPLGLVVLLGVPLMMGVVGVVVRPLHRRQQAYRDQESALAAQATDIVAGLRVLRGVGGEETFASRYRERSQRVRAAGVAVARLSSLLDAAQVLVPGLFVVAVTWLGARLALDGRISVGEFVAFYAYAAFLVYPLRTLTEAVERVTRAFVAARRLVRLLRARPEFPADAAGAVPTGLAAAVGTAALLADPDSGLTVPAGGLTAVACADPAAGPVIADRLARFADSAATLAGVPLRDLPIAAVREAVVLADHEAHLFGGPLRDLLRPHGAATDDAADDAVAAALDAAQAADIVAALPEGLDSAVAAGGRDFSGGQRQRLRLARALLLDPPVLLLVEPTSAVDAHTEARIAARLAAARAGRTTVVFTTSPLLLAAADVVAHVADGRVRAVGRHADLLRVDRRYASTVHRGEEHR
ncbi:MAG TPA: ABC transporter ATP-binding protein [Pilimelia sp.]|nr:ABC transporter ATP-binding protein [Pilimelia sp.]